MMNAQQLLAQYNVSLEQASDWVVANISDPSMLFQACKQLGISTSMLTEIIDYRYPSVTEDLVKSYFQSYGFNASLLDPSASTTTSGSTLSESVGAAAADELIDAVLHWQKDHNVYAVDDLSAALSGLAMGSTHFSYSDLITLDLNLAVASSSAPGFVKMALYQEHTWSLSQLEFMDFASELLSDNFIDGALEYQASQNLAGYMQFSDSSIATYDDLVARAPDYSSHWIL